MPGCLSKLEDSFELQTKLDSKVIAECTNRTDLINKKSNGWICILYNYLSRKHKIYLFLALISLILSSSTNLSYPTLIGKAVDFTLLNGSSSKVLKVKIFFFYTFVLFGGGAFAGWLRVYCFNIVKYHLQNKLRQKLFAKLIKEHVETFQKYKTGAITTTLLQDVEEASKGLTENVASLLRSLNSAFGGTILLLLLSRKLTLVSLSVVPIVGLCAMLYSKFVKKLEVKLNTQLSNSISMASEKLSNLKTVKIFGNEEKEAKAFDECLTRLDNAARSVASAKGCFMGGLGFCINASLLTVLVFGGKFVHNGELTIGNLTSFALYSSMVGLGFSGLSQAYSDFVKSSVSAKKIICCINKDNELKNENTGIVLENVKGEISFENVSFAYASRADKFVIKNLSFNIKPGQIVALAGPSGVGKTTIADLLLKLFTPFEGKIFLDGKDISEINSTWLRQHVFSIVNQEPILFSGSILENIKYGVETASEEDVFSAAKKANVHEFILNLPEKYNTYVNNNYYNISVGQRQRIAIARAILKNTPCLILDEATSALDGEAERLVQSALQIAMSGRSVLLMAHRPSSLKFAHTILVINDGTIVENGTYEELMEKSNIFRTLIIGFKQKEN